MGSCRVTTAFDQPLDEPALEAQAPFQASHPAVIALVIIAKKVQQAMQRQHTKLDRQSMASLPGLTARNSSRNHDIAEFPGLPGRKRQHVGGSILTTVSLVECTHARVWNHCHGDGTSRPGGRHVLQPTAPAPARAPRRT